MLKFYAQLLSQPGKTAVKISPTLTPRGEPWSTMPQLLSRPGCPLSYITILAQMFSGFIPNFVNFQTLSKDIVSIGSKLRKEGVLGFGPTMNHHEDGNLKQPPMMNLWSDVHS